MLDSTRIRACLLAQQGIHCKKITQICKKYDGEEYSTAAFYQVFKEEGIKIRDYRDGKGDFGERAVGRAVGHDKPVMLVRKLGQRSRKLREKKKAA